MMPQKTDINPATGKQYAVNPQSGVWDDNYWANQVEPTLKAQYGGGSGASGVSFNQPTIDLPKIYENLYSQSGITDVEKDLVSKTNAYNEQVSKIKDNPYLSEATMTGRISKLTDKFNADRSLTQNQIATKKADIETQLNLQTKQFDINSQQAQQAWDQFNTLLSQGALDNASGEDIANITRATGISSTMIQSAIDNNKKKNAPKASISTFDDGTNTYAVAIDEKGNVINKQLIGQSEQKAKAGGGASKAEIKAQETQENKANLVIDIKAKKTLNALVTYWSEVLPIEEIYRLYNTYSPYGKAKETLAEVKQGKFKSK